MGVLSETDQVITAEYTAGPGRYYIAGSGTVNTTVGTGPSIVYIKSGGKFSDPRSNGGGNTIFYENGAIFDQKQANNTIRCDSLRFEKNGKDVTYPPTSPSPSPSNTPTVTKAELTISRSSSTNDETKEYVRGQQEVIMLESNFTASPASDVIITEIAFDAVVDNGELPGWSLGSDNEQGSIADARNMIMGARLYQGYTPISNYYSVDGNGRLTFPNLALKIQKNNTVTISIKADIGRNIHAGKNSDFIGFIIPNGALIDAQDGLGNRVIPKFLNSNIINDEIGDWKNSGPGFRANIIANGSVGVSHPQSQVNGSKVKFGSNRVKLAEFNVYANNEDFEIKTLTFGLGGSNPNNLLKSLEISYPTNRQKPQILDGLSKSAVSSMDKELVFSGLSLAVVKNKETKIEIYGDFQTKFSGNNIGDTVQIFTQTINSNVNKFRAIGMDSGALIDSQTSEIQGNLFTAEQ